MIQPTASCQLGCVRCGQRHSATRMSQARQDALVRRVERRLATGAYTSVRVGWFGAEPLLGMPVIRALTPRLRESAQRQGARFGARVVTNGLRLTADRARELETELGVDAAEITLDGPAAVHDARRATKAGGASFATIVDNLASVSDQPDLTMELSVRCNVDRRNHEAVGDLIARLADRGLQRRITVYFSPVYSWGNGAGATGLDPATYAAREIEWMSLLVEAGFRCDPLPRRKTITCLALRRDGEVFAADGDVFNCTEVSYVPAYGTPNRFQIASLDGGPERTRAFAGFLGEIESSERAGCHSCAVLPVCGGACPKAWAESEPPCPSIRANLGERLLLAYAQRRLPAPPPA